MRNKLYLGIILLNAVFVIPANSEEYQSVRCPSRADAQTILDILMEAPTLQYGNSAILKAKLEPMLETRTCTVTPFASELTQYATKLHPEGNIRFGIVQQNKEYLLVFRFRNDGGGGSADGSDTQTPIGFDARNPDNNSDTKSPASGGMASGGKGMKTSTSD